MHACVLILLIPHIIFIHFLSAALGLTEEQKQIQKVATDYAKNELFPNMAKWDEEVKILIYICERIN